MKKLVTALILGGMVVITPLGGTAWAAKNCPPGSHKGLGPDPKNIYCYDNGSGEIVKIIRA